MANALIRRILSQNNISAIQSPYGLVSFSECNSCDSGFKTTPLQNLVSLDLESNEITRITSTDFEGLTALDSLNLNANFITQVCSRVTHLVANICLIPLHRFLELPFGRSQDSRHFDSIKIP